MIKKGVVPAADYTFDKTAGTVTLSANYTGIALSEIMLITNVKSTIATIIYDPFDAAKGGSLTGLVLTLAYNTSAMNNADTLQIIIGGTSESIADGANIVEGATTDAAVDTDTTGTISGKLRGLVKLFVNFLSRLPSALVSDRLPVYVGARIVATPNKTGGGTLLSLQTCASGAVVIGSPVDISGKLEVSIIVHIGRTVATALTNPAKIRIEVSTEASGNDSWMSIAEFLSSTIASTTTATLTTGTSAAATTLPMTATAAILIGDIVYIREAGAETNSEFRRVITINTNTSIVVEEGCTYAHTITTTKVWSKADYWPVKIQVGSYMRMRMVVDCAYALSGQTIVAEGKYSLLDSIT